MKRATIRTRHDRPATIAAAVAPDNTPEMDTRVEDGSVVTTVERPTTGGLQSTVDDYVVNLSVAARVALDADEESTTERTGDPNGDTNDDTHQP
jgi:hypothetical protein